VLLLCNCQKPRRSLYAWEATLFGFASSRFAMLRVNTPFL
jgi:hypothetical protein